METTLAHSPEPSPTSGFKYFPFYNTKQAVFVLCLIGLLFGSTSLYNEYSLDDGIIIHQNEYVLKGVRGIKGILTRDAYSSFYRRMCAKDQLQGGRYRPLSVITYALEQELIGTYRTGQYMRVEDSNHNDKLDDEPVEYTNACGNETETNYEFNNYVDVNNDQVATPNECFTCWDLNQNFVNDFSEDLNQDGIFNEIDCQVYKSGIRHFNNIWLYVLACIMLYLLFSLFLFKSQQDLAFLSALLFLTHPVHSEIVANVRGRDDLFSVLFIAFSTIYAFKFMQSKNSWHMLLCALGLFLAMMSKEYGVLLYLWVPMALFMFQESRLNIARVVIPAIGFILAAALMIAIDVKEMYFGLPPMWLFSGILLFYLLYLVATGKHLREEKGLGILMSAMFVAGLGYLALRLNAVTMAPGVPDTEILNNPYHFASGSEQFATKIMVLWRYLVLLIFPHPLSCDYSYATFEYRNLMNPDFLFSLLLHLLLLVVGIFLFTKRQGLGFAILTYLLFLFFVSNLLFPTGTMMLEGHLFHASMGFAIALAWLLLWVFDRLPTKAFKSKRTLLLSLLLVLVTLYGAKMWERNWDWKNDVTLFLKDVKQNPKSVIILGNAGARWIDLADTREITGEFRPGEDSTRFNDYNGTLQISDEEVIKGGYKNKREAALRTGIGYLEKAVEYHARYVNGYLNLGLAHYKLNEDNKAIYYWKMAEYLYPNNPYLRNYYAVYTNQLKNRAEEAIKAGETEEGIKDLTRLTIVDPNDAEAWHRLSEIYSELKWYKKAEACLKKATLLNPRYRNTDSSGPPFDNASKDKTKNGC